MPDVAQQVNFTNPTAAAIAAFSMASAMQDEKIGMQIIASGMLFLVLCQESGLCIRDTLLKIGNITLDTDAYHHRQIAALRQLIREEYLR